MDVLKNLNAAMEYIEENLCGEIDFERAARIACSDAEGFVRFFRYMTGVTLTEYVRRRRLTLAGCEARSGRLRTIDLAVKYGYDSADSFSRAFKRQHGITPSQARDASLPLRIFAPASFYIAIRGVKELNFRLIEVQERTVCGVKKTFGGLASDRFEKEHVMWAEDSDFAPRHICDGYDGVWYGIWNDGDYWIARDPADAGNSALEATVIPAGTYAAFSTECGGYAGDELPRLRSEIFEAWLPSSGYSLAADFEVEVYHLFTDRDERRKKRYYELWLPVGSAVLTANCCRVEETESAQSWCLLDS